jgi:hypothetical protein
MAICLSILFNVGQFLACFPYFGKINIGFWDLRAVCVVCASHPIKLWMSEPVFMQLVFFCNFCLISKILSIFGILTILYRAYYIWLRVLLMCAGSENDSPRMFKEDQLYIILVLAFGGCDLEAHFFTTAEQSHSVFIQVFPCYTL